MLENVRPLRRMNVVCCPDCTMGDIGCLMTCQRTGCGTVKDCSKAGEGAHAAYCTEQCAKKKCDATVCPSGSTFLPESACRGQCAATAFRLCRELNCEEHGCYAPYCAYEVRAMCE
eukprot:GHVU01117884.1.p2 GENE.GHVU01117884.1~~GHVU01117884.1.p2  ORF type:complete len:116 (+),score=5.18 GHVU01117884.1:427-774(+)